MPSESLISFDWVVLLAQIGTLAADAGHQDRGCQTLSVTYANSDPSRLTVAYPHSQKPLDPTQRSSRHYVLSWNRPATALAAGPAPAVSSRNH